MADVPMSDDVPMKADTEPKGEKAEPKKDEKAPKPEPGTAAAANDDDDDPVIMEYTVHLANQLVDHLHLFQFPLRPPNRAYDLAKCTKMNISTPKGAVQGNTTRFALEIDPKHRTGLMLDEEAGSSRLKTQPYVLTSTRTRNKTNYAIGVVRGAMLHMTGLTNIHQFRPDVDANMKLKPGYEHETVVEEEAKVGKLSAKEQHVMQAMEARNRSHFLEKQKNDTEVSPILLTADDEEKTAILDRLFAPNKQVRINPKHTTTVYLNQMFKKRKERWLMERHAKIPLAMRSEFRWQLQAASIVAAAKVAKFSVVRGLLKSQLSQTLPPDEEVLKYLMSCCCVINGLLVVKEDSDHGPLEKFAREWILLKFWESEEPHVRRADMMRPPFCLPIDHKTFKAVLESVAVMLPHSDPEQRLWMLKSGGGDPEFLAKFPKEAAREAQVWETERVRAITLNATRTGEEAKRRLAMPWAPPDKAGQLQASGQAGSGAEQVRKWIIAMFTKITVWNKAVLAGKFQELIKKSSTFSFPPDQFIAMLDKMTIKFNDGIIIEKRGAEVDKYRATFIKLLQQQNTWSKSALLNEAGEVPGHFLVNILKELCSENGRDIVAKVPALS
eukprot:TRINITY_DN24703_c0_g1_i1.p1 TRINITY_DN24703_c0_g1~~TRINITY_DN24703_c0_g1_i1.p1  ORF type:complete len:635 (+),score=245.43 TRINITY_DN24703_c0_g1_i1:75-1907(+)